MHLLHEVHLCIPRERPYVIRGAHAICNGYWTVVVGTYTACAILVSIRPIWKDCRVTNLENYSRFPECFLQTSRTFIRSLSLQCSGTRPYHVTLLPPSRYYDHFIQDQTKAQSVIKGHSLRQPDFKKGLWSFDLSLLNFFLTKLSLIFRLTSARVRLLSYTY